MSRIPLTVGNREVHGTCITSLVAFCRNYTGVNTVVAGHVDFPKQRWSVPSYAGDNHCSAGLSKPYHAKLAMYDRNTQRTVSWVSGWIGPYEGGVSLLMKFAWVNSYDNYQTLDAVFLGKRSNYGLWRTEHKSLTNLHWARRTNWKPNFVGVHLITDRFDRNGWWDTLVSDERMKVCPSCAVFGYQSPLFQIEAMSQCPIHGDKLLDRCNHCNAPTRSYGYLGIPFSQALSCDGCGIPYGRDMSPAYWRAMEHHRHAHQRLSPLVRWLRQVHLTYEKSRSWDDSFQSWPVKTATSEKRIAAFTMLQKAVPYQGDRSVFFNGGALHSVNSYERKEHRLRESEVQERQRLASFLQPRRAFLPSSQFNDGKDTGLQRYRVYKAIRRRILRLLRERLGQQHRRLLSAGAITPFDAKALDPRLMRIVQTIDLWRRHFEHEIPGVIKFQRLGLHDDMMNRSVQNPGDDGSWAAYVIAVLCECSASQSDMHLSRRKQGLRHLSVHKILDLV